MAAVFYSLALSSTETVLSFSKPVLYFRVVHLLTRPCEYISDSDEKKYRTRASFLQKQQQQKRHISAFSSSWPQPRKAGNAIFFNFKLSTLLKRHLVKEKSFDFHLEKGHSFLSVKWCFLFRSMSITGSTVLLTWWSYKETVLLLDRRGSIFIIHIFFFSLLNRKTKTKYFKWWLVFRTVFLRVTCCFFFPHSFLDYSVLLFIFSLQILLILSIRRQNNLTKMQWINNSIKRDVPINRSMHSSGGWRTSVKMFPFLYLHS